jgi:hypothetical protein
MSSPTSMTIVKNFPSRPMAEAAHEILATNNITAIIQGSDIAGTGSPQGFDLYVMERDLAAAHELLETLYDGM